MRWECIGVRVSVFSRARAAARAAAARARLQRHRHNTPHSTPQYATVRHSTQYATAQPPPARHRHGTTTTPHGRVTHCPLYSLHATHDRYGNIDIHTNKENGSIFISVKKNKAFTKKVLSSTWQTHCRTPRYTFLNRRLMILNSNKI